MATNTTGTPEQGSNLENLLPLDRPELEVQVVTGQIVLLHVFRRITQADWEVFFGCGAETDGDDEAEGMDVKALTLYRRAILRVEGYGTESGRSPETLPDWPECIPREDRLAAIYLLHKVFWRFVPISFTIEKNSVSFEIMSSDGNPGAMSRYFSVAHHFRPPTGKHRERFLLARGYGPGAMHGDAGESAIPGLVSLYDELIEGISGYSVSGCELCSREEIAREMDAYHKLIAVGVLFEPEVMRALRGSPVAAEIGALGPKTLAGLEGVKVVPS